MPSPKASCRPPPHILLVSAQELEQAAVRWEQIDDAVAAVARLAAGNYDLVVWDVALGVESDLMRKLPEKLRALVPAVFVLNSNRVAASWDFALKVGAAAYLETQVSLAGRALAEAWELYLAAAAEGPAPGRAADDLPHLVYYLFTTADLAGRSLALGWCDEIEQRHLLTHHDRLQVELAFQEALANAIEHGNLELLSLWREEIDSEGSDRFSRLRRERLQTAEYGGRLLRVAVSLDERSLRLLIKDQGPGFTVSGESAANEAADPNCFGRGLLLIRNVMTSFALLDQGRELRMEKLWS